ncbi:HlyD family secretion protein [Aminipila terrae]|uniref:HlyD family efflux transporter periplasmic adaptor subunit n=1 Tax=Aminipila terrae TaxID=2697030 RepID=A0A6P1MFN0_9FIRM|nr:HlyD family efflux transporter periplasmic adaptor subunit [Aminipila terrae]QHI72852.1 HlyD family efflux transporter periplasmic adaptor subunit [Aminipila terrae]
MKAKRKIIFIIVILIAVIAIFYIHLKDSHGYTGEVEGIMEPHCAEVSGKIVKCPIELGSQIKKGDVIAVIDNTNQKYAVEQLSLNLQKAKLAVNNSKVGRGGVADNNYNAAKASYDSAVILKEKATEDYSKAKTLYEENAISEDALNSAKVAYETAVSKVADTGAQIKNISDKTAGNAAEIDVALLESQLNQQNENLQKYTIVAGCDGIVMSKNYKEGDVVSAGYNIADISSQKERYAVIYFPEDKLDCIKYNQKAVVDLGDTSVEGQIKYIDVKAQYTPKEMQSAANRNQESVRVKVLLPEKCNVNVGQKVKVQL